ncbi:type IV pilus inner membrane component PilO [Protaetiibacter intestinalis]|uniref:Pilus assembly protein PilO n=1 Tax=Protaetiibacter intestinalis TaxID=2419774 RepID=A0A387B8R1_9MICO|nr:hypothetical protein [Protaetiibacter intestinalis]AYF97575.1 hypothetical protein D7I47_04395 [Protaetiibacter intestinalis]
MKLGTRVWGVITVVVVVGLVAGGWFLGAAPLLDAKTSSDQARAAILVQNDLLAAQNTALEAKRAELDDLEKRASELETAIPSEVGGADFIRDLNDLAVATGVSISSIGISDGTRYLPPVEGSDVEGAPTPLTDPLITEENFVLVPVTVTATGGWNELLAFVHAVQTGQRLVLVTGLTSSADAGTYQFQISGTMYALQRPGGPAVDTEADADGTSTDGAAAS